jgi:thymidylate synthase
VSWKNIVVEMLWFLSGQTDISILKRHNCKFWDAWADPQTGKVPSAYGNFWRQFPIHGKWEGVDCLGTSDQIRWVLDELKRNPMSRRMVVSAWAPGNAQTSKLPPCHCLFMFNVQNDYEAASTRAAKEARPPVEGEERRLCLHLTQRSCDVALGVPYNIASYALLLSLFSHFSGIEPGTFGHTLVDDHVPGLKEQIARTPRPLPRLVIDPSIKDLSDVERLMQPDVSTDEVMRHFVLEGYQPHEAINFKVAV